jgi:hypothetical protein
MKYLVVALITLVLCLVCLASSRAGEAGDLHKVRNTPPQSSGWTNANTMRPVAVICVPAATTANKATRPLDPGRGFQTIPLNPGQNPASLCGKSHLSSLVYRLPAVTGLPPPPVPAQHPGGAH